MRATQSALRAAASDQEQLNELLNDVAVAAASGQREALDLLLWAVDELALVRSSIRRVVINEADVDDVAQDVLVALATTIEQFRGEAPFKAWLHQVARFKAIAHLRRKRDEARIDAPGSGIEPGEAVRISSVLANRATLRDVLDTLPDHYGEAVVLRDVEQLPYEQLAERLGINLNTAKSRVARGRAMAASRLVGTGEWAG